SDPIQQDQREDGPDDVEDLRGQAQQQRVGLVDPDRLPQRRRVVEDDVDPDELLQRRQDDADPDDREQAGAPGAQVAHARPVVVGHGVLDLGEPSIDVATFGGAEDLASTVDASAG